MRDQARLILDSERGHGVAGGGRNGHGIRIPEQGAGDEAAQHDAGDEHEIPTAFLPPVISKMREVAGIDRGAHVAEVARDAKRPISEPEKERSEEPEQWAGNVPRPWGGQEVRHHVEIL